MGAVHMRDNVAGEHWHIPIGGRTFWYTCWSCPERWPRLSQGECCERATAWLNSRPPDLEGIEKQSNFTGQLNDQDTDDEGVATSAETLGVHNRHKPRWAPDEAIHFEEAFMGRRRTLGNYSITKTTAWPETSSKVGGR